MTIHPLIPLSAALLTYFTLISALASVAGAFALPIIIVPPILILFLLSMR